MPTPTTPPQTDTYNSLEEIQLRKDQLAEAIEQEGEQIATLWGDLFKKREDSTKAEYVTSIITNSIAAIDAFLLVRKLVKNYSGLFSFLFPKKRKHR